MRLSSGSLALTIRFGTLTTWLTARGDQVVDHVHGVPDGVWQQRRLAARRQHERTLMRMPIGRTGTPGEIAEVALFLASPHARWTTGQTIALDGGQLLVV